VYFLQRRWNELAAPNGRSFFWWCARALGAEVIEEPVPLRFNLCNRRARPAVPPSGWQFELAPLGIGRMALPIGTMDASTRQGP
jgi:hypothetical protein